MTTVLVAGATGFVGRRLVGALVKRGHEVRALVRRDPPAGLLTGAKLMRGDVLDEGSMEPAMSGVDVVYYLVHSMSKGREFEETDRRAAEITAGVAKRSGVRRIIYLGGLGGDGELSPHLASRAEVARVLASTGVLVTTLRAAIIVGAGGTSYEMLRNLVERLPVMITPRWVQTRCQPIAIDDVIAYLVGTLENEDTAGRVLDIGGPDVLTYRQMMERFAAVEGKRRWILGVPVLTPRLSSYWVNLVTPIPASIARPLIEGLRNEVVVTDHSAEIIPVDRTGYDEAVMKALVEALPERLESGEVVGIVPEVANRAYSLGHQPRRPGVILEARALLVDAPAREVWESIASLGGENGWYYMDWAWGLRGWLDGLVGGAGNKRGRPQRLAQGELLDSWIVDRCQEGEDLVLRTGYRLPKEARMALHVRPQGDKSVLVQWVEFEPNALTWAYWWAAYPIHRLVFRGLVRAIADRATTGEAGGAQRVHA